MRDAGVYRNDQIQVRDQRRGIGEIFQIISEMEDVAAFAQQVRIRRPDVSLQAHEGGVNAVEERQYRSEWNRSVVIVRMSRAARPGEADAAPAGGAEARFPVNDGLWIGAQIWRCGWKGR